MDRAIGQLRTHLTERSQRNNTLLWYCGDNGTSGDAAATVPFRGVKSTIYDGGLRVPGLIEWPARITKGRQSDLNSVTSDILPTLCDLTGQSLPDRPLDGISLKGLLDGEMTDREKPIAFWQWTAKPHEHTSPYFDQEAQTGTTPLVKLMNGKATRDFQNFRYEQTNADDYAGPRALLDGRFKLVVDGSKKLPLELFDVIADPTESHNIAAQNSDVVQRMQQQLQEWQTSVLHSLTGADYN